MSFVYVDVYWNNHHNLLHATERIGGAALWANLHLLFWLFLVPFVTGWMGGNEFAPLPTALYGVVLLFSGVAWRVLQTVLTSAQAENSRLKEAVGADFKGKLSIPLYSIAIGLSFATPPAAIALYLLVAAIWFIPDRRFENAAHPDLNEGG